MIKQVFTDRKSVKQITFIYENCCLIKRLEK